MDPNAFTRKYGNLLDSNMRQNLFDFNRENIRNMNTLLTGLVQYENTMKKPALTRMMNEIQKGSILNTRTPGKYLKMNNKVTNISGVKDSLMIFDSIHDYMEGARGEGSKEAVDAFLKSLEKLANHVRKHGKKIDVFEKIFSDNRLYSLQIKSMKHFVKNKTLIDDKLSSLIVSIIEQKEREIPLKLKDLIQTFANFQKTPLDNKDINISIENLKDFIWKISLINFMKSRLSNPTTTIDQFSGIMGTKSKYFETKSTRNGLKLNSNNKDIFSLGLKTKEIERYFKKSNNLFCVDAIGDSLDFKIEKLDILDHQIITPAQIFDPASTFGINSDEIKHHMFYKSINNKKTLTDLHSYFGKFRHVYYQGENTQIDNKFKYYVLTNDTGKTLSLGEQLFVMTRENLRKSNENLIDYIVLASSMDRFPEEIKKEFDAKGTNGKRGRKSGDEDYVIYSNEGKSGLWKKSLAGLSVNDTISMFNKSNIKSLSEVRTLFDIKRVGDNFQVSYTKEYNKNSKRKLYVMTQDINMCAICIQEDVPVVFNSNGLYYIFGSLETQQNRNNRN